MSFGQRQADRIAQIYAELSSRADGITEFSPDVLLSIAVSLERVTQRKSIHLHVVKPEPDKRFGQFRHSEPVDFYINREHGWRDIKFD
jgi:hypothetical protein